MIHVDATWKHGIAGIAVCEIIKGQLVACQHKRLNTDSAHAAELEAIKFGQELYPDQLIHNDSIGACSVLGAVWIPRANNSVAHIQAGRAFRGQHWQDQKTRTTVNPSVKSRKIERYDSIDGPIDIIYGPNYVKFMRVKTRE